MRINYKKFIEYYFCIKNKEGVIVPFVLNDTQNYYWDMLKQEYPDMRGIRENILKFRQPGFSSLITGIFAADFIMSELGEIPVVDADVYSHKDKETQAHFARFEMFMESYLLKDQGGSYLNEEHRPAAKQIRKSFLDVDTTSVLTTKKHGAQYHSQTASAKVSGRGGTKQNIHWSEVAFYPNTQIMNAKTLVTGSEEQVPDGVGKIFRETTGNSSDDFFSSEYQKGKDGISDFKSRFLGWFIHGDYVREAPPNWKPPEYYNFARKEYGASIDQCYWHYVKTRGLTDKVKMREYPTDDTEAFLLGGDKFFSDDSLLHYNSSIRTPVKEVEYAQAL